MATEMDGDIQIEHVQDTLRPESDFRKIFRNFCMMFECAVPATKLFIINSQCELDVSTQRNQELCTN